MGLFSKSPEEKKLKELTGGFLLCDVYLKTLKNYGISKNMGYFIQKTLREEIKMSKLHVNEIEPRLAFLLRQFATINREETPAENKVSTTSPEQRTLKFLINQKHNLSVCPKCGSKYLKTDSFCYKCGHDFKSRNLEFKFSYAVYLDCLMRHEFNPSDNLLSITVDELHKKAQNDGYVESDSLTQKGMDFLKKNRHFIFYSQNPKIERYINISDYDAIFKDVDAPTEGIVHEKLTEYFTDMEDGLIEEYRITEYMNLQYFLAGLCEKNRSYGLAMERYLRLFILELNNFSELSKKAEPQYMNLSEVLMDKIKNMSKNNELASDEIFRNSFISIRNLNPAISFDESENYLKMLLNGERILEIEKAIYANYYL